MTSAEEAYLAYGPSEEIGTLEYLLYHARDKIVNRKLDDLTKEENRGKSVALFYGAGHMRCIGNHLDKKLNYSVFNAAFLKVYDL